MPKAVTKKTDLTTSEQKRAELAADVQKIRDINKGRPRSIPMARVALAQHARNVYHASIPHEDTLDNVLDSKYWSNLQHQLRAGDIIEALSDDLSLDVSLRVVSVAMNNIQVRLRSKVEYEKVELGPDVPPQYQVVWAGLFEKWRVMDQGKVIVTQLSTADEARLWLLNYLKAKTL